MILNWILELEETLRRFVGRMEQMIYSHECTRAFSHYPLGQRCLYIGREILVCAIKKM
jgi:hypothetical protein